MKQKYCHHLRVQNQSKPEAEVNLKENLQDKDKIPKKTKSQKNQMHMTIPINIITMIITPLWPSIEAADRLVFKAVVDHLEVSIQEEEVRNPNTTNDHFRIRDFREAHTKVIEANMLTTVNHIFKTIKLTHTEEDVMVILHTS